MQLEIERALESWCAAGRRCLGQILIEKSAENSFRLCHRDDAGRNDLIAGRDAAAIAKFDDAGNYRPLKTAPNLRHGWRLELTNVRELRLALELFYPGRLVSFYAFERNHLRTTPLRQTLERQSGMYRVAATISDAQIDDLVANFCRSEDGCLRTILWKRDASGAIASTKLPGQKFNAAHDQTGAGETCIPLLCQEACNLLVTECRKIVTRRDISPKQQ
jgi:sirohydrochlorin cobaltochelatase